MCLTASRGRHQKLLSQSCHLRADQFWRRNSTLEIESSAYGRFCLDANPQSGDVYLWDCDPVHKPHQRWTIKGL
jgi:hypothetical protein